MIYILAVIVFIFYLIGIFLANRGMKWYETTAVFFKKPTGYLTGVIWVILVILNTLSSIIVFFQYRDNPIVVTTILLIFLLSGSLFSFWNYYFFVIKNTRLCLFISSISLAFHIVVLIITQYFNFYSFLLLIPYLIWSFWIIFLAYTFLKNQIDENESM